MKSKKKINKKYELGSYVEAGQFAGTAGNMLGEITGDSAISSMGSGVAAGSAFGVPGMLAGGALGLVGGLIGQGAKRRAEKKANNIKQKAIEKNYFDQVNSNLDTDNENPYGQVFADGGMIPENNQINIEKGELQINPQTGKILREYTGMNPETGGLYTPHSKGKDPKHNIVMADPGTFIITKEKAKVYKDAIDNNDKLHQNTILQNIRNYKANHKQAVKMKMGSFVENDPPEYLQKPKTGYDNFQNFLNTTLDPNFTPGQLGPLGKSPSINPSYKPATINTSMADAVLLGKNEKENNWRSVADNLMSYAPSLMNMGKGMFGNVDRTEHVNPTINPYKSQILGNMPQDIDFNPVRQQLLRQQNTSFGQIDNTTSGSPIARANKQNVVANTQNQLGLLMMDNQGRNNQIRGQRAGIYSNLGAQEMQEANRVQQLNLGIDERNLANKGAKQQLLDKGLSQLQQTYQNKKFNNTQMGMDKFKASLLPQIFTNVKYYEELFGKEAIDKLLKGK